MHFPPEARGNNFDNQIKIIYSWNKRIPFASSRPFCAGTAYPLLHPRYDDVMLGNIIHWR